MSKSRSKYDGGEAGTIPQEQKVELRVPEPCNTKSLLCNIVCLVVICVGV